MGADEVFDLDAHLDRTNAAGACATLTDGDGVDVVIEAAGSAARDSRRACDLARDGGAYVDRRATTRTSGDSTINAHQHINRKHLEIRGCWGSEVGHFLRALRALERWGHEVPWARIGARPTACVSSTRRWRSPTR